MQEPLAVRSTVMRVSCYCLDSRGCLRTRCRTEYCNSRCRNYRAVRSAVLMLSCCCLEAVSGQGAGPLHQRCRNRQAVCSAVWMLFCCCLEAVSGQSAGLLHQQVQEPPCCLQRCLEGVLLLFPLLTAGPVACLHTSFWPGISRCTHDNTLVPQAPCHSPAMPPPPASWAASPVAACRRSACSAFLAASTAACASASPAEPGAPSSGPAADAPAWCAATILRGSRPASTCRRGVCRLVGRALHTANAGSM